MQLNLLDKMEIVLKERILLTTNLLHQKQTQNVPNSNLLNVHGFGSFSTLLSWKRMYRLYRQRVLRCLLRWNF
ncbi:unnamed protein product [Lactuca virosa]|uniref:Uncharacterized protein n=1 Tax=Lactuca virosa TaxID=75947 RepID=A0AAU9ML35_9ASTR|nr:unnamed protein product [Lactuca virosa]